MKTDNQVNFNEDEIMEETPLGREKVLVGVLLDVLKQNSVNALVIMENEEGMCHMSHGISGRAIANFIIHVFLEKPQILIGSIGRLRSIFEMQMNKKGASKTLH